MAKKRTISPFLPNIYVSLTYNCLYDDYDKVNVHEILNGIPSICILKFIVKNFYKVEYALTDICEQRKMIREMCNHIKGEPRKRIWKFLNEHPYPILIECYGIILLEALVLQNWISAEPDDQNLELCEDEYEPVYKALLYCNQRWTDWQIKGNNNNSMEDVSLLIDIPVVEFKHYKDFILQMYKAVKFFEFCEGDEIYSKYLPYFYDDYNVKEWKQYVLRLFSMMEATLNNPYVTIEGDQQEDRHFFDQYCVNLSECRNIWEDNNALSYFRSHFMLKLSRKAYMLLNPNFLVDKFYQGLKFDFFKTLYYHSLKNAKGKVIKNYADFCSEFGSRFSEPVLLYSLMKDVFGEKMDAIFTGEQLKAKGVQAEPDLYMRIADTLFLFEYKDITLSDDIKFSGDAEEIKKAICDRICKYEDGKAKKGAGQLHYTMENIFMHGSFDAIDPKVEHVKSVFPIIMTTDRSFSALGVNLVVIKEYYKIIKSNAITFSGFISVPIIMDIDTIIKCANRLNNGTFKFEEMLTSYISNNQYNLCPFNSFVEDKYLHKKQIDEGNVKFLLDGFIENIKESVN